MGKQRDLNFHGTRSAYQNLGVLGCWIRFLILFLRQVHNCDTWGKRVEEGGGGQHFHWNTLCTNTECSGYDLFSSTDDCILTKILFDARILWSSNEVLFCRKCPNERYCWKCHSTPKRFCSAKNALVRSRSSKETFFRPDIEDLEYFSHSAECIHSNFPFVFLIWRRIGKKVNTSSFKNAPLVTINLKLSCFLGGCLIVVSSWLKNR